MYIISLFSGLHVPWSLFTFSRVFSSIYQSVMKSITLLAWLFKAVIAQLQCYNPDGSLHPDQTPCNGTAEVTHCCGGGGACLTNGLCFMAFDNSLNTGTCTDMNWKDPSCFQTCVTGKHPTCFSIDAR